MRALPLLLLLCSCHGSETVTWLEGASFGWVHFNHRLTHWETRLAEDDVDVAVIGGTSTTGVITELPAGCESDTCQEFPIADEAEVAVSWASADTKRWVATTGTAELVVGPEGATTSLMLTLPRKTKEAFAVIQGFSLDGGEPLTGGEACYTPKNGWLPTQVSLAVGDVDTSNSPQVTVLVAAMMGAGESLEEVRACMDEVDDEAQFRFLIDVLVVGGDDAPASQVIETGATFGYGTSTVPEAQADPATVALEAGPEALSGWRSLDWKFHVDDPDGRGAYLRTLGFGIQDGGARGVATNYSPGTQLSGFDFAFKGEVVSVDLGVEPTRGTVEDTLPALLDTDGAAVVTTLPLD